MSQIRHKTLKSSATIAIIALMPMALTAQAATVNSGLRANTGKTVSFSTPLNALKAQSDVAVIDWRTPSHTLIFDGSETNWTSGLNLTLSADPVGRVNAKAPIYVAFNGQTPVKINTKGRGFDAHISLETTRLKARHNTIRIYYEKSQEAECLLPQDGGWALYLSASSLKIKARQKAMNYRIQDVEARLSNAIVAPKLIGLVAVGPQASEYQALLAQGVGMRMDALPHFTTAKGRGDIDFIVGRRDVLSPYVRNKKILKETGANIYVDIGKPMRVILTGDTDAEVLNAAQSFAQFSLPHGRMTEADPGHMALQPTLKRDVLLIENGQTKLSTLGDTDFAANWNPDDRVVNFNVKDPHASAGEILVRLNTPKTILRSDNHLSLSLNGHPLGQTSLDKNRKSVAFPVPAGILQGQGNELRFSADLQTDDIQNCASLNYADSGIIIGAKSTLSLSETTQTPVTDLSRFTATGAPFSDKNGASTVLVLPKRAAPYNDALRLLAQLAKTNGGAWTQATILRGSQAIEAQSAHKNVLFITPSTDLPRTVTQSAPKSLKAALQGQALNGDNLLAQKSDQFASLGEDRVFQMATRQSRSKTRVQKGGIAALFESPYDKTRLVGVITNTPGYSFRTSLNTLQNPQYWNKAEGSVARWNDTTIIMAALSSPLPHFVPIEEAPVILTKFEVFKSQLTTLDFQNFELPKFDLSALSLPEVSLPEVNFKEAASHLMFWKTDTAPLSTASNPPAQSPSPSPKEIEQPREIQPQKQPVFTPVSENIVPEYVAPETPSPANPPRNNDATPAGQSEPTDTSLEGETNSSFLDKALAPASAKINTDIIQDRPADTASPILGGQHGVEFDKRSSVQTTLRRSIIDQGGYPQTDIAPTVTTVSQKKTVMERFATPVTLSESVASVQAAVQPARQFVKTKISTLSPPAQEAFAWTEAKVSSTGLILMLALLTLLGSFGLSDPKRQAERNRYK